MIETKNRFPDNHSIEKTETKCPSDTFLWHITISGNISDNDKKELQSLTPNNCSIFLISKKKIIYHSDNLSESINSIQNELHLSHEATFVQQIIDYDQRHLRVLTIPFDSNICIGLVTKKNLHTSSELEDSFLHTVHHLQKEYTTIKNSIEIMHQITNSSDPIVVLNRTDGNILSWSETASKFFNLSQSKLHNETLHSLQIKFPKATQRKMNISNRTIGNTDCSVVQYTLKTSDTNQINSLAIELQTHAEHLLTQYRELQTIENVDQKLIQHKIIEITNTYNSIADFCKKEKKQ